MKTFDCNATRPELVAYLDGELAAAQATAVEQHLAACAACAAERAALAGVWGALDVLPGLEPRAGWLETVEAAVLASAAAPGPKRGEVIAFPVRRILVAVAVAACLTLAAGVAWLASQTRAQPGDSDLRMRGPAPLVADGQMPEPAIDQSAIDESAIDESAIDESAIDEPAIDEPAIDESAIDESAIDEHAIDEPGAVAAVDDDAEDLTEAELAAIEELEVLVMLDELDELDVLDALELLEDLDDDELLADET